MQSFPGKTDLFHVATEAWELLVGLLDARLVMHANEVLQVQPYPSPIPNACTQWCIQTNLLKGHNQRVACEAIKSGCIR